MERGLFEMEEQKKDVERNLSSMGQDIKNREQELSNASSSYSRENQMLNKLILIILVIFLCPVLLLLLLTQLGFQGSDPVLSRVYLSGLTRCAACIRTRSKGADSRRRPNTGTIRSSY
mgnify:CR=1 FL=1